MNTQMLKNRSKHLPKSSQNWTRSLSKTTFKKTIGKKTHEIDKKSDFGVPTGSLGGKVAKSIFDTFSSPGVPGTPLGHPWGPKWSQDLPQESPGPPRASFFNDFYTIFDGCF